MLAIDDVLADSSLSDDNASCRSDGNEDEDDKDDE